MRPNAAARRTCAQCQVVSPTLSLFAQSMLIGLSIAAPVGQIGVLAIQRTLQHGRAAGIATGLGAAVADAGYGALGAFGVGAAILGLNALRLPLALGGAAVLAVLAVRLWRPPSQPRRDEATASHWVGSFASALALTVANPSTIVSFVAVFGVLAARSEAPASPSTMVAGVFVGSMLWWLMLAAVVGHLRERIDARWQRRINRGSALVLATFAIAGLGVVLPSTPR
jgi:threonine/homoserine/homoserine lactone efflux protein